MLPSPDIKALVGQIAEALHQGKAVLARQTLRVALQHFPRASMLHQYAALLNPRWDDEPTGQRVRLLCPADHMDFVAACYRDEAFLQKFNPMAPRHLPLEALKTSIGRRRDAMALSRGKHWVVHDGNAPLGLLSFVDFQVTHRRCEFMIGFPAPVASRLSGEAALLALDLAFVHIGLHKLTSLVFSNNPHSQKSTLALGFEQEGHRRLHIYDMQRSCFYDCYENGLLREHYLRHRGLQALSQRLLGGSKARSMAHSPPFSNTPGDPA